MRSGSITSDYVITQKVKVIIIIITSMSCCRYKKTGYKNKHLEVKYVGLFSTQEREGGKEIPNGCLSASCCNQLHQLTFQCIKLLHIQSYQGNV